jgi:WhiB family redox-sensing transcriptional regulator
MSKPNQANRRNHLGRNASAEFLRTCDGGSSSRATESWAPLPANNQVDMSFDEESAGWQRLAACRGEDSAYYFAPSYFEKRREKLAREAVAKRICAVCPVRQTCLDYALVTREGHGVWGGLNETERRAILKRQALEAS